MGGLLRVPGVARHVGDDGPLPVRPAEGHESKGPASMAATAPRDEPDEPARAARQGPPAASAPDASVGRRLWSLRGWLVLLVLAVAPLLAGLSELFVDPAALAELLLEERVLSLWWASLRLGVTTAAAALLLGVPVGWALARSRGSLAAVAALILPLPLILPPWMAGVAWTSLFPVERFWGSVFLLATSLWPFVALFAMRGFRATGRAGDVAALARGRRAAFLHVELPLALPSILSGALFVFVFAITDFAVVDYLSFTASEPFVVLASEVFQRWARLDSGAGAAAVSVPAILTGAAALAGILALESRHAGRFRAEARQWGGAAARGLAPRLGLLGACALVLTPVVVLLVWASGAEDVAGSLSGTKDAMLRSLGVALATALVVAVLGVSLARQSLALRGRKLSALLFVVLAPLAAPGVLFAVGEIRLWNHPANPLSDAVYPSSALLVLALAGRYLPLGVLAARALLARTDETPRLAARLAPVPAWRRWLAVDLRLDGPALGLAGLLGFLLAMRELDMIVLIPAGSGTLAHHIFALVHIAADELVALYCVALLGLALVPAAAARLLGAPGVPADD